MRSSRLGVSSIFCLLIAFSEVDGHELVDVRTVNPRIEIEMRYAMDYNTFGYPIYSFSGCFLVREVADKLSRVQEELEKKGYGLKVFDAYRPTSFQMLLSPFANMPEIVTEFYTVQDFYGHNRGTAVDVTLVCLGDGELEMPTDFSVYNEKTPRDNNVLRAHVYHNSQLLEKMMKRFGFIPSPGEWWHFDYYSFACYPLLNVSFEDLANETASQNTFY